MGGKKSAAAARLLTFHLLRFCIMNTIEGEREMQWLQDDMIPLHQQIAQTECHLSSSRNLSPIKTGQPKRPVARRRLCFLDGRAHAPIQRSPHFPKAFPLSDGMGAAGFGRKERRKEQAEEGRKEGRLHGCCQFLAMPFPAAAIVARAGFRTQQPLSPLLLRRWPPIHESGHYGPAADAATQNSVLASNLKVCRFRLAMDFGGFIFACQISKGILSRTAGSGRSGMAGTERASASGALGFIACLLSSISTHTCRRRHPGSHPTQLPPFPPFGPFLPPPDSFLVKAYEQAASKQQAGTFFLACLQCRKRAWEKRKGAERERERERAP